MSRSRILSLMLCLGAALGFHLKAPRTVSSEWTWVTPPMTIDRAYPSMSGPRESELFVLDSASRELAWITAFRARSVQADEKTPDDQRYLCHTNLIFPAPSRHVQPLGEDKIFRLFTISQGQSELKMPEGFGIPLRLDTPLMVDSQVLNDGESPQGTVQVRQKAELTFVRQSELDKPLKPLFCRMTAILRELENYRGGLGEAPLVGGDGCGLVGAVTPAIPLRDGRQMVAHWTVPPGRREYRREVTRNLNLPYDTTLHMASLHVHSYCEWVELRDLTAETTLLHLRVQRDGSGRPAQVEDFRDAQGIPMYKSHRYEVVSVYNNDSDKTQDAMVNLFLFLHDKEFQPQAGPSSGPP